ncbi:MAG TPA: hypothetical protein VGL46_19880 [Pseudonocardiaceae bacterium]
MSFPDRQKKAADDFLLKIEGDKRQGAYIDPSAGRLTFGEFVRTWLDSQTHELSGGLFRSSVVDHERRRGR